MFVDLFQERDGIDEWDGLTENDEVAFPKGLEVVLRILEGDGVVEFRFVLREELTIAELGFDFHDTVDELEISGFADAGNGIYVLHPRGPNPVVGLEDATCEGGFRPDDPVRTAEFDGAFAVFADGGLQCFLILFGEGFEG